MSEEGGSGRADFGAIECDTRNRVDTRHSQHTKLVGMGRVRAIEGRLEGPILARHPGPIELIKAVERIAA